MLVPRDWVVGCSTTVQSLGTNIDARFTHAAKITRRMRLSQGEPADESLLLLRGEQRSVAAGRRRVDRHDLLGSEAPQIVRAAGLRAGAGKAGAAERLGADHGADHVAVDVDVAVG